MRQVLLLGNDITQYVLSIPEVVTTAGDFGQLTINDLPSIAGNNTKRFWDQTNPASPFFGAISLSDYPITIYNDSVLVYTGTIQGIHCDNKSKTANVTLKSDMQKKLEKGLFFASSGNINPSDMVKEICSQYKIDLDASSFSVASSIYDTDNITLSSLFKKEGTVFDGIQQILEIGIARVYLQNNRLYYDVYQKKTSDPIFTASDKSDNPKGITLLTHPNITTIEKEVIRGYSIKHVGLGGESIFGDIEEQGKSIDGSSSSPVRIMTAGSAVWIGERWLEYFAHSQQDVAYSIHTNYGKSMLITCPIRIEYDGYTYICDTVSVNNAEKLETELNGVTR